MAVRPQRQQKPAQATITSKLRRGLALLLEAGDYAKQTSGNPWDFAVEIHQLRSAGLSENDLRFLVQLKYLSHAWETAVMGSGSRHFQLSASLSFTRRSCFVLTSAGLKAAAEILDEPLHIGVAGSSSLCSLQASSLKCSHRLPIWDSARRVLFFDGKIVKRFKWQAVNQELVLAAFQEEEWPIRIYDPLAPQSAQDMKRRLSDTIKCLNRGHEHALIHFRGDGTGEGVVWEPAM